MSIRHAAVGALALLVALPAAAHQVWLERDGQTVHAYFGEPIDNVRERTGGYLDRIAAPRAFTADPAAALPVTRRADSLDFTLPAGATDARLVEDGLAPFGRPETGRTKAVFLAREGRSETRGVMDLELVPVTAGGNVFTLMLRGQPLPRSEVTIVAPPRWERRLRSDADGRVTFETPWAGRYVAEAVHTEERAGGEGDGAYVRMRFVSTLSFSVAEGIAWAPR
jgi:hypothetical protein